MTTGGPDPDREELTIRFPDQMLSQIDETRRSQPIRTRSEFVSEAISRAVEHDG